MDSPADSRLGMFITDRGQNVLVTFLLLLSLFALLFGPIVGDMFFYNKEATGETLWIPYAFIAVVVLVLAAVFLFSPMPDIKM